MPLPLPRKGKRKNHRGGKKKKKTGKRSAVAAERIEASSSEKPYGEGEEKRAGLGRDETATALCAGNDAASGAKESLGEDGAKMEALDLDQETAATLLSEALEGEGKRDDLPLTATNGLGSIITPEEEGAAIAPEGRVSPSKALAAAAAAAAINEAKVSSIIAAENIGQTGSILDNMINAHTYGDSFTGVVGGFALELGEGGNVVELEAPTVRGLVHDRNVIGASLGEVVGVPAVPTVEAVDEAGGNAVRAGEDSPIDDTSKPTVAQSDTAPENLKEPIAIPPIDIPTEIELLPPIAEPVGCATTAAQNLVILEGELDSRASATDPTEQRALKPELNDESQLDPIVSAQKSSYKHGIVPLEVPTPQPPSKPYYETRPAAGKGLGMFATHLIPRGTRILSELPLMLVPSMTYAAILPVYASLAPSEKGTFLLLAGAEDLEELANLAWYIAEADKDVGQQQRVAMSYEEQAAVQMIFSANSFSVGKGKSAIFAEASRMNHSCVPNVYHTWNGHLGRLTVHALRDIQRGEEVLTTYVSAILTREQRGDEEHLGHYGFVCRCQACKPGSSFFEESATRREAVVANEERLALYFAGGSVRDAFASKDGSLPGVREALRYAQLRVELLMEEGIVNMDLVKCIHEAGELALLCGKFEEARNCARVAVFLTETCAGKDSPHLVVLRLQVIEAEQHLRRCWRRDGQQGRKVRV